MLSHSIGRFKMQQFTIGQRWVSAGELQLGVGMVLEVEFRTGRNSYLC